MAAVSINLLWTKVVDAAQADFLITWGTRNVMVQVATMSTTATPDAYAGALYSRDDVVTRASIGAGHVWVRLVNSVANGSIQVQVENSSGSGAVILGGGVDVAGSRTIIGSGPTVMGSLIIPGGTMGTHGLLIVEGRWITDTAAHNRTMAFKFGGQVLGTNTLSGAGTIISPFRIAIQNRGVTNSQSGHPNITNGMDASGSAVVLGTVDTTVDQTLELVGTVAAPYAMTLEHFFVTVRRLNV